MAPPLINLQNVHLTFGGTPLLSGAELAVSPGERLCLVGRNGCGKSTLLKIAAGLIEADTGTCFRQPDATIRYLPQEPDLTAYATTLEYVEAGLGPGDDTHRAALCLYELGLTGEEPTSSLSGGEARRAALARVLAPEPDVLLLDEPTNHLDLPAIEWLERELRARRSALVLISHDRAFLTALAESTVWIDRGVSRRMDKGFEHFEAWRDEVLEQEERDRHKLDRKIAMELDWLRYGVTARRKRNVRRLGELHQMRKTRREARGAVGVAKMTLAEADVSGKLVAELKGVSKDFGAGAIVDDFSIRVQRGDRVGLVGRNGAGKTTLLKLITGDLKADEGRIRLGTNLEVATLDQKRGILSETDTPKTVLTRGSGDTVFVNGQPKHVVSYLKDFLFSTEQTNTPVTALSGGERGRLILARAFAQPSNLLILDEPTNDLDLETLDLLQELIADYSGTVLLVSHDRDFLDKVVTSVVMSEGNGKWQEYAGGYSDMLLQRGTGVEARKAKGGAEAKSKGSTNSGNKPPRSASKPAKKLSFKDKHALETLPAQIDDLNQRITELQGVLADPDLYTKAPDTFHRATKQLGETQAALEAAEEDWLRLEMLREELEKQG